MENEANTQVEIFISKDQQRSLALDTYEMSVEIWLTKGYIAPPTAKSDELLDITGSSRELKAKVYSDRTVKEVDTQYSSTISNMNEGMGAKDKKIVQFLIKLKERTPFNLWSSPK